MKKSCFALLAVLAVSACASYPIHGKGENGERFLGSATTYIGGNGTMNVTSEDGAKCQGKYSVSTASFSNEVDGSGILQCADGRTGTFNLAGTKTGGRGFGKLSDGKKFDFYFGDSLHISSD